MGKFSEVVRKNSEKTLSYNRELRNNEMEQATAYQDNRAKPDLFEYVTVMASDFNGKSFDGSPFSSIPKWLYALEDKGKIRVADDGQCTDYANWEIKNGDVWEHATPGDFILNENGKISVVKITKQQERIIQEKFMKELSKEI